VATVTGALFLALASVIGLIYFIHHISRAVRYTHAYDSALAIWAQVAATYPVFQKLRLIKSIGREASPRASPYRALNARAPAAVCQACG
jgi:uncharacterized membrane protein